MGQIGCNLTDAESGILVGKRYLIHDRDPLFTAGFVELLVASGVKSVKLPPRSPNLNAHAERFVRSIKEEPLEKVIFLGESSLRKAIQEFTVHYHQERNHHGIGNQIIRPFSRQATFETFLCAHLAGRNYRTRSIPAHEIVRALLSRVQDAPLAGQGLAAPGR